VFCAPLGVFCALFYTNSHKNRHRGYKNRQLAYKNSCLVHKNKQQAYKNRPIDCQNEHLWVKINSMQWNSIKRENKNTNAPPIEHLAELLVYMIKRKSIKKNGKKCK